MAWAWVSEETQTSLTESDIPLLKARRAESPLTCSACTRLSAASRSVLSVAAISVNGSDSSVSVCESRSNAGPSWPRSAAMSCRLLTVPVWHEATLVITDAYSDVKCRSDSTASSSGLFVVRNFALTARAASATESPALSYIEENQDEVFWSLAVCSSHTLASRNVCRSAPRASWRWPATRRRNNCSPAWRRWMKALEKRSSVSRLSTSGSGGTMTPGNALHSRCRSQTKSRYLRRTKNSLALYCGSSVLVVTL